MNDKIKLILIELDNGDVLLVDSGDITGFYIKKDVCCAKECDNSDYYIDGDYSVCGYCQHNGYALKVIVAGKHYTVKLYKYQSDAIDTLSSLRKQIYGVKNCEIQEVILNGLGNN